MKRKVRVLVLIIIIAVLVLYFALNAFQLTSARRLENKYQGEDIEPYISMNDEDNDGINDQSDILLSALAYLETKPKYKSKYYGDTGYPNDKYGVCTDVVAYALLGAGYDLQKLVNEDKEEHLDDYPDNVLDDKIDFRRVRNLKFYLNRNAESLTTNVYDINEWQGGDIVVFSGHIGIVSDRRNKNGVPYLIHHGSRWQLTYEEDKLETRKDIVGHYRITQGQH